jgi:uracil-DNA glycosylase family 4
LKNEVEKTLLSLKSEAEKCRGLYDGANLVFGVGPATAKVILVGEAPGYQEDKQGVPFVGAAGKNLNELLEIAGLRREEVYITNVVKVRPPGNRDPTDEEIKACRPFIEGEISAIKPKLVVALGRIAAKELSGNPVTISKEHGSLLDCGYAGVKFKLFMTYHPAAAMYSGRMKLDLKNDFTKLSKILRNFSGLNR